VFDALVVPIDGSPVSLRAIASVTILSRSLGVPIRLVTVISPGIEPLETEMELRALLEEIDAPTCEPVVLFSNDVPRALSDFVERGAGLLCMSTHGRGGLGAAVLGSTAYDVLAVARQPVVLIGPGANAVSELRDIVVGVEMSEAAQRHASFVRPWATRSGARVHLVNVLTDAEAIAVGRQPMRLFLDQVSEAYLAAGASATAQLIDGDDVAELLDHAAAALHAGLIVVGGTRTGGSLADLGLGSVAQRVVRHAPCPTLVIPPARPREES
jgi:nucleotide-binding universal stress UspA family protein